VWTDGLIFLALVAITPLTSGSVTVRAQLRVAFYAKSANCAESPIVQRIWPDR